MQGNIKNKRYLLRINLLFIIICSLMIIPLLLIVSASFSKELDIRTYGYSLIPRHFNIGAYQLVLQNSSQLVKSYIVTIFSTISGVALGLFLITTFSYVISRQGYKYGNILTFFIFFTMIFRGGMVPSYILISKWLGLRDTVLVLFLPCLVNGFYILLMKAFFKTVPNALYESAKIDGASEWRIFFKIALPLAKPGIATIGLLLSLQFWNDWFQSLMYTESTNLLTLQAMLNKLISSIEFLGKIKGQYGIGMDTPTMTARMAICVIAAGPALLVFPFFQKYFQKGVMIGAVKE